MRFLSISPRIFLWLAALFAFTGCRAIAEYDRAAGPTQDAGLDGYAIDGRLPDGALDGAPSEASPRRLDAAGDQRLEGGRATDGLADHQPIPDVAICGVPSATPGGTIYYYSFDQTPSAGGYPEELRNGPAAEIFRDDNGINQVPAPGECKQAVAFTYQNEWNPGHLRIDGSAFAFSQGSIRLRVQFFRDLQMLSVWGQGEGIICRSIDYSLWQPGRLCLYRGTDGRIAVWVEDETYLQSIRCSVAAMEVGRWYEVGINFGAGGLELFIGGARQEGAGTVSILDGARYGKLDCSKREVEDLGIDGNDFFWVVGGTNVNWAPSNDAIGEPLNGVVDELSIADFRRNF